MAGTKSGGAHAAATNKKLYGANYYAKIGKKGGKNGHTGGFYNNHELASKAGRLGGLKSKRRPVTHTSSVNSSWASKPISEPIKKSWWRRILHVG